MKTIFISCTAESIEETEFVKRVCAEFTEAGLKPVTILENMAGNSIFESIQSKMKQSDYVVAVLSHNGATSPWVNQELGLALAGNKQILLIVEEGVDVGAHLSGIESVRFDKDTPWNTVHEVVKKLKAMP